MEVLRVDLHGGGHSGSEKSVSQEGCKALWPLAHREPGALVAHDADEAVNLTHLGRLSG